MEGPSTKKERFCQICEKNPSKYLCPRCGVPYCSLACYKDENKHLQCSESFYKDCVVENIRTEEQHNPEGAQKMKEVLQRFHEQYDGGSNMDDEAETLDSDDDEPLEERLRGIDLNNADAVWQHLTDEEKREFQTLVRNSDGAADFIPEWVPWWEDAPEKLLVVEVAVDDNSEAGATSPYPKLHKRQPDIFCAIPKMSELTRIKPNAHVAKGMINVVAAYAWVSRLFNGDLFDPAKMIEVASSIIFLSSFLKNDGVFKNIEHAVADVPLNASQVPALSEGGTAIHSSLNRDIWLIIKGPDSLSKSKSRSATEAKSYILSALTECYTVIVEAVKAIKIEKVKATTDSRTNSLPGEKDSFSHAFPTPPPAISVDKKLQSRAKRKLLYLLAFANEYLDTVCFDDDDASIK